MEIARSVGLFVAAGLAEIGGGYLVWRWLREGAPWWAGLIGAAVLVGYGVIPTLQHSNFGRVYAAYGGVFVIMSLLWGWGLDRHPPDRFDWIGAGIVAVGVGVIFFAPLLAAQSCLTCSPRRDQAGDARGARVRLATPEGDGDE
jgi:small multidrug resistance family-3 protein